MIQRRRYDQLREGADRLWEEGVRNEKSLLDKLNEMGYVRCIRLPSGQIAGLMSQLFTVGLFVGLDEYGYARRYCYETKQQAVEALGAWDGNGDPPGLWIKEKPSDRLGPGATKN